MAKKKPKSRAASKTAALKKSPARKAAKKAVAKSTARKKLKAGERELPVKRARPKQRSTLCTQNNASSQNALEENARRNLKTNAAAAQHRGKRQRGPSRRRGDAFRKDESAMSKIAMARRRPTRSLRLPLT